MSTDFFSHSCDNCKARPELLSRNCCPGTVVQELSIGPGRNSGRLRQYGCMVCACEWVPPFALAYVGRSFRSRLRQTSTSVGYTSDHKRSTSPRSLTICMHIPSVGACLALGFLQAHVVTRVHTTYRCTDLLDLHVDLCPPPMALHLFNFFLLGKRHSCRGPLHYRRSQLWERPGPAWGVQAPTAFEIGVLTR